MIRRGRATYDRVVNRRHWLRLFAVLAAAWAASALWAVTDWNGTTGHAFSHLIPAAIALVGVAAAVARRPPATRGTSIIAAAFLIFSSFQIAESIGAHAWGADQTIVRNNALHTLHDAALVGPFVSILVLLIGLMVAAGERLRRRRLAA